MSKTFVWICRDLTQNEMENMALIYRMEVGKDERGTANEIQIFTSEQFGQMRTVLIEGEPWFVAVDVCRALKLPDTHKVVGKLDDDEKGCEKMR